MQKHQIEAWAYRAVDRVKAGQQLEDALLEAKATWIEPQKAARRIAGHCNAARGAPVLWLFGLDETRGVTGVPPQDLAGWWPRVAAEFQGPVPVPHDVVVDADGQALVALLFDGGQPPYVVKNRGGGAAELEVPWREGTRVISARHEHLIRMLSPRASLPTIEIVEGHLSILPVGGITPAGGEGPSWKLILHLYVTPGAGGATLPNHLCRVSWQAQGMAAPIESRHPSFAVFHRGYRSPSLPPPVNVQCTQTETVFAGPGMMTLTVGASADSSFSPTGDASVRTSFGTPGGTESDIVLDAKLTFVGAQSDELARWEILPFGIRVW